MSVKVKGEAFDTVADACERMDISRNTLLSYIKQGLVSSPPTVRKGQTDYRYFTEEWYAENMPKIRPEDKVDGT